MNNTIIGNIYIIKIDEDLDHKSTAEIRRKVDEEIKKNPVNLLIFDLSNIDFMDSSGIGLILGRYKLITSLGGKLCIVKPNENLCRIINLSGLHKVVNVYDSIEEAINERGVEIGKFN